MAACVSNSHSRRSLSANHALEALQGYDFDTLRYYLDASEASDEELAIQSHSCHGNSDFFSALIDYADTLDASCFTDIGDNSANNGEDYVPASLEGRTTVSLPSDVFHSLMDEEEDEEEAPPIKRCETATRHMLRQMSARRVESSHRSGAPSNALGATCRKNMMRMTVSSFRSMLVPSNKSRS